MSTMQLDTTRTANGTEYAELSTDKGTVLMLNGVAYEVRADYSYGGVDVEVGGYCMSNVGGTDECEVWLERDEGEEGNVLFTGKESACWDWIVDALAGASMDFCEKYSLHMDDVDEEYMRRTGVGVHADYGTSGTAGEVVYRLTAEVEDGDNWMAKDAGWTTADFVRYWNERGTMWQEDLREGGGDEDDAAGVGGIVRTWMGKKNGYAACYIVLKAS